MQRWTSVTLLATICWLLPAPGLAAPPYGSVGGFSGLVGMVRSALRLVSGLAGEMARPPAPPTLTQLGPNPTFGFIPGPERLLRYADQGYGRLVLQAIRRYNYDKLWDVGPQFTEVRRQVRDHLLTQARPGAEDLRELIEDSRTPAELAPVLNRIGQAGWRWQNYKIDEVFRWGQGRIRYLASKAQPKSKGKGPPSPPPPAPAVASRPPQPPSAVPPDRQQPRVRSSAAGWAAAAGALLAAAARALGSLPPVVP